MEEWRPAPHFPNYEVSSLGQVRRKAPGKRTFVGRMLKRYEDEHGYNRPILYRDKKGCRVCMNRLVCEAFHGPPPSADHEAAHNNGNPRDDSSINLRWATRAENANDRFRHGTAIVGINHHNAKLSADDVARIREKLKLGMSRLDVAAEFGVSKVHVGRIERGKSRKHTSQELA